MNTSPNFQLKWSEKGTELSQKSWSWCTERIDYSMPCSFRGLCATGSVVSPAYLQPKWHQIGPLHACYIRCVDGVTAESQHFSRLILAHVGLARGQCGAEFHHVLAHRVSYSDSVQLWKMHQNELCAGLLQRFQVLHKASIERHWKLGTNANGY